MAVAALALNWQGALIMGGIIGLVELFFVHQDEQGLGWMSHGLHALPVAMVLTFIGMNVEYFFQVIGYNLKSSVMIEAGVRVLLGIIATIKVKGAAAIIKGHNSIGEKLPHALIIGALIATSPYIWTFLLPMLPSWLGGMPAVKPR